MSTEFEFDFDSYYELRDELDKMCKKMPDACEDALKSEGFAFRNKVKKEAKRAVDEHTGNLTKGFRISKVAKVAGMFSIDFMAEGKKNPHWHLIENGHELVKPYKRNGKKLKDGGKVIGFVPGRQIVREVIKEWGPEHEKRLRRVLEKVKKEAEK